MPPICYYFIVLLLRLFSQGHNLRDPVGVENLRSVPCLPRQGARFIERVRDTGRTGLVVDNLDCLIFVLAHYFHVRAERNTQPNRTHGVLTIDIRRIDVVSVHGSTTEYVRGGGCAGSSGHWSDFRTR